MRIEYKTDVMFNFFQFSLQLFEMHWEYMTYLYSFNVTV